MKKTTIGAAAAAILLGLAALPASAGVQQPTMTVSAEVSYVGDSVTISNATGELNTCVGQTIPAAGDTVPVDVHIEVYDPSDTRIIGQKLTPDAEGNWSVDVGPLEEVGTYVAYADCENVVAEDSSVPSQVAPFEYVSIEFQVVAQAPTTTEAPTTTTTAATAAVTATPAYTG